MTKAHNIFAYTAPGADFPEFVSVNSDTAGKISISVRSPKAGGGAVAAAPLNRAKARELGLALIQATN